MSVKYYYGKKTKFVGKTLFQTLSNLQNFGIGRMVTKNLELLENPGQKCYYIIKKVEPVMDTDLKEGAVYAKRVFRGATVPGLTFIDEETWHSDWQLIPKDQESSYRTHSSLEYKEEKLNPVLRMPPLMKIFLKRHGRI